MPVLSPNPPVGVNKCAASPARNVRPARYFFGNETDAGAPLGRREDLSGERFADDLLQDVVEILRIRAGRNLIVQKIAVPLDVEREHERA